MKKKELNREIGYLVGQIIVDKYLPTLSTDMLQTSLVIPVSKELTKEWEDRNEKWRNNGYGGDSSQIFDDNLRWYQFTVEDKYLERELKITDIFFNFSNKEEVMKGIQSSLWDSDLSHYSIKDIVNRSGSLIRIDLIMDRYKNI